MEKNAENIYFEKQQQQKACLGWVCSPVVKHLPSRWKAQTSASLTEDGRRNSLLLESSLAGDGLHATLQ